MKILVKNPQKYELSVDATEKLLDQYIRPKFNDCSFLVKQSANTNSIYIKVIGDNAERIIRLSDHPNGKFIYHYISRNTKTSKVVAIIVNSVEAMKLKRLDNILENL